MLTKIPAPFPGSVLKGYFCLLQFFPLFIFSSFQDISEGITAGNYLCLSVDCAVERPVGLRAEDLYPGPSRLKGSAMERGHALSLDLLLDLDLQAGHPPRESDIKLRMQFVLMQPSRTHHTHLK